MNLFSASDLVYLSGPMTGITDYNFPHFKQVEEMIIRDYGCRVLSPTQHIPDLDYEQYMILDMTMVQISTHVLMLNGWQNSEGARLEKRYAEGLNKIIVFESELENIHKIG